MAIGPFFDEMGAETKGSKRSWRQSGLRSAIFDQLTTLDNNNEKRAVEIAMSDFSTGYVQVQRRSIQ